MKQIFTSERQVEKVKSRVQNERKGERKIGKRRKRIAKKRKEE